MNEKFAERIREARETIEVLRKVHPANRPDLAQIAEFFELHAAHERKHGHTANAERAAQRAARLRENPSPAQPPADPIQSGKVAPGRTDMKNAARSDEPRGTEARSRGDNRA
jgi:hypothetical protein